MYDETEKIYLLQAALTYENSSAVKYIINSGYYHVNERAISRRGGHTALTYAAEINSFSMCELLIELGAEKSMEDLNGKLPIDYARENDSRGVEELLSERS